jgi:5-formaminoimidazole-4-carboxamide-1-beta-D-ribofuranosyl 5'-monophosphate synthetase
MLAMDPIRIAVDSIGKIPAENNLKCVATTYTWLAIPIVLRESLLPKSCAWAKQSTKSSESHPLENRAICLTVSLRP